jgi:GTP-binding protein
MVTAKFITSAPTLKHAPDLGGLPEFLMVGRSNVGKSSFINTLTRQKGLAKTSSTPGKTRLINFFELELAPEHPVILVDLPGYGYAKVSHKEQEQWHRELPRFLQGRETIHSAFQLLDIRHPPKDSDIQMRQWLESIGRPVYTILTKMDKLSRTEATRQSQAIAKIMNLPEDSVLMFSAVTGYGRDKVIAILSELESETHSKL